MPLVHKVKGKRSTSEVYDQLQSKVFQQLEAQLNKLGLDALPENLSMIAIKDERRLEVYSRIDNKHILLKSYPFTAFSGQLGPKLKEGDRQIPEGIYAIDYLNPNSSYYLSMKVNYPNEFDKRMADQDRRSNLGGDIFIHGKNKTIGCIPLGDHAIEELFVLVVHVKPNSIPIIISPTDFRKGSNITAIENLPWTKELYESIAIKLKEYEAN